MPSAPYFWIAAAVPGLLATLILWRRTEALRLNAWVILLAIALTTSSAHLDLRSIPGLPDDPWSAYAIPFFPLVYLVARRYRVPDPLFCYAATFLTLLGTDVFVTLNQARAGLVPVARFFVGIGGGGLADGLFLAPCLAGIAAWLVAHALRRRVPMLLFKSRLPAGEFSEGRRSGLP